MVNLLRLLITGKETFDVESISDSQVDFVYTCLVEYGGRFLGEGSIVDYARDVSKRHFPSEDLRLQLLSLGVKNPKCIVLLELFNRHSSDDLDVLYAATMDVLTGQIAVDESWAIAILNSGVKIDDDLQYSLLQKFLDSARVIGAVGANRIPMDQSKVDVIYDCLIKNMFDIGPALEALNCYWTPAQSSIDEYFQYAFQLDQLDLLDALELCQFVPTRDMATKLAQKALETLQFNNFDADKFHRLSGLRLDMADIFISINAMTASLIGSLKLNNPEHRPAQNDVDMAIELIVQNGRYDMLKALLKLDFKPSPEAIARIKAHPGLSSNISRLFSD
jgi:hypothetical protein